VTHGHPHEDGAGPHHGPAHDGDLGSPEPGGFDEYDHEVIVEPTPTGAPHGVPVVSDGTAGEGDSAEPDPAAYVVGGHPDTLLAVERLEDLRRLQAEYVNYKKRVDRDRALAREHGISHVLESLLPVLDDIHLAREHGDLEGGPMTAIADKLEAALAKLGVERFGEEGQEFNPAYHEALMNVQADLDESATTTTVVKVLQPGYKLGDRVVRAARVAVADPQ
jgi:molecular chaperone GrpE